MYCDYLTTQTRKVTEHQQQLLPVPRQEENAAITTVDGVCCGISSVYSHFEESYGTLLCMTLFLLMNWLLISLSEKEVDIWYSAVFPNYVIQVRVW